MRKLLLVMTAAAALVTTGAFTANRAEAMTLGGSAAGLRAAIEDTSATLDAAMVCRHRYYTSGRRCWWVPGGWRHRSWRWRRWRHW